MSSKSVLVFVSIIVFTDAFSTSDDLNAWNLFKVYGELKKMLFFPRNSQIYSRYNFSFNFHPQKKYSKHYDTPADEMHRFHIFVDHKRKIDEHNLHHENGIASFKMGLNKYSDLSYEEFIEMMNGYDVDYE